MKKPVFLEKGLTVPPGILNNNLSTSVIYHKKGVVLQTEHFLKNVFYSSLVTLNLDSYFRPKQWLQH